MVRYGQKEIPVTYIDTLLLNTHWYKSLNYFDAQRHLGIFVTNKLVPWNHSYLNHALTNSLVKLTSSIHMTTHARNRRPLCAFIVISHSDGRSYLNRVDLSENNCIFWTDQWRLKYTWFSLGISMVPKYPTTAFRMDCLRSISCPVFLFLILMLFLSSSNVGWRKEWISRSLRTNSWPPSRSNLWGCCCFIFAATFLRGETRRGRWLRISEVSVKVESAELPLTWMGLRMGKTGGGSMYSSLSDKCWDQSWSSSSLELQ